MRCQMSCDFKKPKILFITPEISHLPAKMSGMSNSLKARGGAMADISAEVIDAVYEKGADVHVALPDYRTIFDNFENPLFQRQLNTIRIMSSSEAKVHLAADRVFFHKKEIYSHPDQENIRVSISFQREIINRIIPSVLPDLIHCNDWMTGLIPAMAKSFGIPCLFTIHNFYNVKAPLSFIEDRGIDTAWFWQHLFFERQPLSYEETRDNNPVDFLASGISAAHFVNTTCPGLLNKIIHGEQPLLVDPHIRTVLLNKANKDCVSEISNSPDTLRASESVTAAHYISLYEKILNRPFVNQ